MARASGPVVGLDIGSTFIKVVEVVSRGGRPDVTAVGIMPTPADTVIQGLILDPPTFGEVLRHLLEVSGIKSRKVISSIAGGGNVTVRIIPVPRMPTKELGETMKYEIDRFVPFAHGQPIEKDYQILPVPADVDTNMQVLLAVALQEVIGSHVQAILAAGLEPVAVEVEPLAVARSLTGLAEGNRPLNETVGIINMGAASTEVTVVTDGVLIFPRTISIAGDSFTKAIAENLGMRVDAAERLKRQYAEIDPDRIAAGAAAPQSGDFGLGTMADFGFGETQAEVAPPAFDFNGPAAGAAPGLNPQKYGGTAAPAAFDVPGFAPAAPAEEEDKGAAGSVFDLGEAGEDDLFPTHVSKPPAPAVGSTPAPTFGVPPAASGFDLGGGFDVGGASPIPGFDLGTGTGPIEATPATEDEEAYTARQVQDILLPVLGELVTELRRSLEYYRSHNQGLPLARLILCGGSARMRNMDRFLEAELGLPVQIANPLAYANVNMPAAPQDWLREISPVLAVALGLAEREVIEAPREYVPRTLAMAAATAP